MPFADLQFSIKHIRRTARTASAVSSLAVIICEYPQSMLFASHFISFWLAGEGWQFPLSEGQPYAMFAFSAKCYGIPLRNAGHQVFASSISTSAGPSGRRRRQNNLHFQKHAENTLKTVSLSSIPETTIGNIKYQQVFASISKFPIPILTTNVIFFCRLALLYQFHVPNL